MNTIAQSFASLVLNNNGFFKSQAQADYLLSICDGMVYTAGGNYHGSSWSKFYVCDSKGVVKVIHNTLDKGDVVEWERVQEGVKTVQEIKEQKRINREIKAIEKQIRQSQEAWDRGEYKGCEYLYHDAMKRNNDMLIKYKSML